MTHTTYEPLKFSTILISNRVQGILFGSKETFPFQYQRNRTKIIESDPLNSESMVTHLHPKTSVPCKAVSNK